jgi:hypothetical protein
LLGSTVDPNQNGVDIESQFDLREPDIHAVILALVAMQRVTAIPRNRAADPTDSLYFLYF